MVKKCARFDIGIRRIATGDGSFLLQSLFTIAVISAGILLKLNGLQWTLVILLSLFLLTTGFYRSAAHLLTSHDDSMSWNQVVRIKAMSNIIVLFAAGIAFFSYLMIFVPKITEYL